MSIVQHLLVLHDICLREAANYRYGLSVLYLLSTSLAHNLHVYARGFYQNILVL